MTRPLTAVALPREIGSMVQYKTGSGFGAQTHTVIRTSSGWKRALITNQMLGIFMGKIDEKVPESEIQEGLAGPSDVMHSNREGGKVQHAIELEALKSGSEVLEIPAIKGQESTLYIKRGDFFFVEGDRTKLKPEHFLEVIKEGRLVFKKKK